MAASPDIPGTNLESLRPWGTDRRWEADVCELPGGYRTMDRQRVRVDPSVPVACAFVDHAGWPRGTVTAVVGAIRVVADLTGLTFGYAPSGRPGQPCTYVTVAVHDRRSDPKLGKGNLGYGGQAPTASHGGTRWVTGGRVVLALDMVQGPNRKSLDEIASVVMHELGHVLGLAHNQDPSSIMHPRSRALVPSERDRQAFAWLGNGPTLPRLGLRIADDGEVAS